MHDDFLISPVYGIAFECPTLSYLSPKKGKREKWKEEKNEYWPFKSPEVTSAGAERDFQQWGEVQLEIWISNPYSEHRSLMFGRHGSS